MRETDDVIFSLSEKYFSQGLNIFKWREERRGEQRVTL